MWNPFRRNGSNRVQQAFNAAVSALSGRDLYGFMWRSKQHSADSSTTLSAVFCAVQLYTGIIASLPRAAKRIDVLNGMPDRHLSSNDHPACKIFLHYANPNYHADDMIVDIVHDMLQHGNYYALREYDSQQRTFRLHYVHPSRIPRGNIFYTTGNELVDGKRLPKGRLVYRIETGSSASSLEHEAMLVAREDIVHLRNNLPDADNNRSFGVLEKAIRSFEMYENSEEYGVHFYKKGHKQQTFLSTEQRLAPDVLKRVEGFFKANPDAAMEDAFATRILEQNLKPVNIGIPMQQLQFIETRAFSVEDVARFYSVPLSLLHSKMGNSGGSDDLSKVIHQWIQLGVHPFISRILRQLRNELFSLSFQPMYQFEFNIIYLYRTIISEFSQALRNLFEIGAIDRFDICNLLGMPVDPSNEQNSLRFVPTNLMTVDHSIALRDKAVLANDLLSAQIDTQRLKNESARSAPQKDTQDNSPIDSNLDNRIVAAKNAFNATIKGLQQFENRVYEQKKNKHTEEDLPSAMNEWLDSKFKETLTTSLNDWSEVFESMTQVSIPVYIDNWIAASKLKYGNQT